MASDNGSKKGAAADPTVGSDDQAAILIAQQAEADEAEEARESKNGSPLNEEIGDVLEQLPEE